MINEITPKNMNYFIITLLKIIDLERQKTK